MISRLASTLAPLIADYLKKSGSRISTSIFIHVQSDFQFSKSIPPTISQPGEILPFGFWSPTPTFLCLAHLSLTGRLTAHLLPLSSDLQPTSTSVLTVVTLYMVMGASNTILGDNRIIELPTTPPPKPPIHFWKRPSEPTRDWRRKMPRQSTSKSMYHVESSHSINEDQPNLDIRTLEVEHEEPPTQCRNPA